MNAAKPFDEMHAADGTIRTHYQPYSEWLGHTPRELIARVRAVLRRARPVPNEQLRLADLEMDLVQHKVRRGGRSIPLGPTEFRLLRHFLENPARVIDDLRELF